MFTLKFIVQIICFTLLWTWCEHNDKIDHTCRHHCIFIITSCNSSPNIISVVIQLSVKSHFKFQLPCGEMLSPPVLQSEHFETNIGSKCARNLNMLTSTWWEHEVFPDCSWRLATRSCRSKLDLPHLRNGGIGGKVRALTLKLTEDRFPPLSVASWEWIGGFGLVWWHLNDPPHIVLNPTRLSCLFHSWCLRVWSCILKALQWQW